MAKKAINRHGVVRNFGTPEVKSQLAVLKGQWFKWTEFGYGGEPVELGAVNGYEARMYTPGVRMFTVTTGPRKGTWVSGNLPKDLSGAEWARKMTAMMEILLVAVQQEA